MLTVSETRATLTEEKELIRRIVAGEKEEFRIVVQEHKELIFSMIMRQVGDPIIAEDLLQETFIKAFGNLKRFRGDSRLETWLVRIALNETNNYFTSPRYRHQQRQVSFDPMAHDHEADSTGLHQEVVHERQLQEFRRALAKLKPKFREVLTICSLEGRSYEEAAQIFSIPVGTVRSRLNTARLLMKKFLSGELPLETNHEA